MKSFMIFAIFAVATACVPSTAAPGAELPPGYGYVYPPPAGYNGYPEMVDRIGEVLDAIDSPERRSKLAESWLQFSRQTITRSLEQRDQWLGLQKSQLRNEQQAEQFQLEMSRLQMQIEQLRAQNLQLERENLQLRLELGNRTGGQSGLEPAAPSPPADANQLP